MPRLPRVFKANNETKPIVYVSFDADTNIDGSADAEGLTINWHEEDARNKIKRIPLPNYLLRRAWRENAATIMYRLLWEVDSAAVTQTPGRNFFVREVREGHNEPNDLLVTVTSSSSRSTPRATASL